MLFAHAGDHVFGLHALFLRCQHHRRAVGVVGAAVAAVVAAQLLEAHPDVGLDVLDHVAEVDAAVGIGQGGGYEDFAFWGHDCRAVGVCREKAALCHKGRGRLKSCF